MIQTAINAINSFLYNRLLIILLIGAGLYFTIRTKLPQIRLFGEACRAIMEKPEDKKKMSSFQALKLSTSSRVGTINII